MKKYIFNLLSVAVALMFSASVSHAAVTYTTTVKNARMDAITTAIGTSGKLVIGTSALSGATGVLCTITLNSTAAAAASSGVLTLSGFPKTCTASATGTAAKASIRTSADVDVVTGLTVGTSGSDVNVDNTSINSGQTVTINSFTITHAMLNRVMPYRYASRPAANDPAFYFALAQ